MLNLRTQLLPIAKGNAQHMREQAAKARTARDFKYANRIDRQAMKWSQLTVSGPEATKK